MFGDFVCNKRILLGLCIVVVCMSEKYLCLVSGESFESDESAEEHAQNVHNLSLHNALVTNEIFVELDEDDDPEKVYNEQLAQVRDSE